MAVVVHFTLLVVLILSSAWFGKNPTFETGAALGVALIALLSSEKYAQQFSKLPNSNGGKIKSFDSISAAFYHLKNEIDNGLLKVSSTELIQHSSERSHDLILSLFRSNSNVELYLQDLNTVSKLINEGYITRVKMRIDRYRNEMKERNFIGTFRLYLYRTPASLNSIKLIDLNGRKLLVFGWYAYPLEGVLPELNQSSITGGENPCFMIDSEHSHFGYFEKFFDSQVATFQTHSTYPEIHFSNGNEVCLV